MTNPRKTSIFRRLRLSGLTCLLLCTCWNCTTRPPSGPPNDADTLRQILAIAASDDISFRHATLSQPLPQITNPVLRQRMENLMPELQTISDRHARCQRLIAELKEMNAITQTAPGGPAWLHDLVGDSSMSVFDRLVTVDLNDRQNPHAKNYQLNQRVNDNWLARLDGLSDITKLDIANSNVQGTGLVYVETLPNLESINLTLTPVTDEHLRHLSHLIHLKNLGLASTQCDGTGCQYLGDLKSLENLNLHNTPVSDKGLEAISQLTSLERLEIVHTFFTDKGAANLANLKNLQRMQMGSRKATGAAVAPLRNLPKLRELDLHDLENAPEAIRNASAISTLHVLRLYVSPIQDADLKQITNLAQLEDLVLSGAQISDAGLESLGQLKSLKKLDLGGSKIPAGAIEKLKIALHGTVIIP